MKRLFIFAATAIALFGCSDDPDSPSCSIRNNEEIKISTILADVQPSKTVIDNTGKASWANGDVLGLFCAQTKLSATSNLSFTLSGLPDAPVWAPASPIYWANDTTVHKFLAYAPYASGNTSSASVKLPALTPQTGTVNPAQDFLISNSLGTTGMVRPANGTAGLTFTHAFALIQFQITINASIATGATLQSITLAGGSSDKLYTSDATSTINLSTGLITPSASTTNTLTATPGSTTTLSTTATNFSIIILPGIYAPTVKIVIAESALNITIPTASIASTTYAAGSKYTYTVGISRTAISLSNPIITDWAPVPSGSINGGI